MVLSKALGSLCAAYSAATPGEAPVTILFPDLI